MNGGPTGGINFMREPHDDALDGFVMPPEPSEMGRAAAIICGHDSIMALGVEGMTDFHGFVQEVLATTVEPELERHKRLLLSCRLAMEHSQLHGGPTDWTHMIAAINELVRNEQQLPASTISKD